MAGAGVAGVPEANSCICTGSSSALTISTMA